MTTTGKPVHESLRSKLFRVYPNDYQNILHGDSIRTVAMKVLKDEFPNPDEIELFYKEYEVLRNLSRPGIRRVLAKAKLKNKHSVFLEWVDGVTIARYGRRGVTEFLCLSRQIVEALAELHMHGIVHNNISTQSIMVKSVSGHEQIKIISLGQSSMIDERVHRLDDLDKLEGDLHFTSPDNVVDFRSDLYSLGCVFYFMLTGKVPFESDDRSQLMNMHAACHPLRISEVNSTVPAPLSDLVEKLMSKKPVNRYQSTRGLLYDLSLMQSQHQTETGIVSNFVLARKDRSGQLQLSEKLYGRTDQITTLLSSFDRVRMGTFEKVLVTGCSGTGKSSLVNEVRMPVTKRGGYFISGKYDPLQLFEPYSGILQAFTNLCDLLLKESEEKLNYFRMLILESLGDEGKILSNVMPKLHLIIGDQPDIPAVGGIEIKNRFNHVFRKFVRAICTAHRPLLLFIDDLQWADSASLDLLSMLIMDREIEYLLFVGAYRNNEVSESHPLATTLSNVKDHVTMQKIEISNLSRDDTNKLVSHALNSTGEDTSTLTDVVHGKTLGNAFFVKYFLKSLLDEDLLYICYDDFKWKWDTEKIKRKNITENVVNLMSEKIVKLQQNTQDALKIASCLGSHFDLFLLQLITEEDVKDLLQEVFFEGMIVPSITNDEKCHFSHDRIQQAAYSLIPESDRGAFHLRIGRVLQKKLIELMKLDENLFVVVNQLNTNLDMIIDESEQEEVARLNLRAAEKARLSSALELAAGFLSAGITLLGPNCWMNDYELSLKLYSASAEMDYCNGDFDHMDEMLKEVFENATSVLDKVESFSVQIKGFRARKKIGDALETGIRVLGLLGEEFPPQPNDLLIQLELNKTQWMMLNKSNDVIVSMPAMEDERKIATVRMMGEILLSARMKRFKLLPLLAFRIVQFTMDYGFTKYSIHGLMWYGTTLCGLGKYDEGYHIGQLLLKLLDRFTEKECQCWVNSFVYSAINHWKENIHFSLKPFQHAFQVGLEVGENEYAFAVIWRYCSHSFWSGKPLVKLEREMKVYCDQIRAYKQEHILLMLPPFRQAVLNFMGRGPEDPTELRGEAFSEESMETSDLDVTAFEENVWAKVSIRFNRMVLAYFFHEYDKAAQRAEECKEFLKMSPAIYENSIHVFFHGLISMALAKETQNNSKWIKIANESVEYMRKLAENAPDNFLHKAHLLEAELATVNGCLIMAMDNFNKAINLAEDKEFMHEEALACERAGIYCVKTKQNIMASKFLSRAYQVYREWGAEAKARHLQELFASRITKFTSCESVPNEDK